MKLCLDVTALVNIAAYPMAPSVWGAPTSWVWIYLSLLDLAGYFFCMSVLVNLALRVFIAP